MAAASTAQPSAGQAGWREQLRAGGYRVTPQRQLVLESVERLTHATPERILADVQRTAQGVNLSTVYRALEVLEEVGLVTHAHIGHGSPAYHSTSQAPHLHLVCGTCGEVSALPAEVAVPFVEEIRRRTGFRTDVSHVSLHGRCAQCAGSAANGGK